MSKLDPSMRGKVMEIHNLVEKWESSDRIPLSFDDWNTQVIGDGDLKGWVEFNITGYLNYLLSYHRGEAEDQGAHGDPWLTDAEQETMLSIIKKAEEVIA